MLASRFLPISDSLKGIARPTLQGLRALPVHSTQILQSGRGPLAVFLPARGPNGASLLRIYAIARQLRAHGWRTLVLPWRLTLAQRRRFIARSAPDILVMQTARHALNDPALYSGCPVFYDMDDADFHLPHLADQVRAAMPRVTAVIAGSRYIADWARAAGAPAAHVVWTGTPVLGRARPGQADRPTVIAWAQTRPMDYRREGDRVRALVTRLAGARAGLTLRLYDRQPGDDPAYAQSFAAPGLTVEWRAACRYRDYLASFDDVALGLAPLAPETPFSRGKSFGKVLAYLDARVPVIASAAGEHGRFFTAETGVVSNAAKVWETAALDLLADATGRQAMADAAYEQYRARLSIKAAAARLDDVLGRYLA